jgi:DNA-binding transcriptional ArsR family regulator
VDYPARAQPAHRLAKNSMETPSPVPQLNAAFAALADPMRREMLRLLLHKPRRAGELAQCIDMSPQALSRHLRVLRRAGLIAEQGIEADARVRLYSVQPSAFQPVQHWISQAEDLWRRQLHSFKAYAESTRRVGRAKS